MAELSPSDLLEEILAASADSALVEGYAIRTLDLDILRMRLHLANGQFVAAFD